VLRTSQWQAAGIAATSGSSVNTPTTEATDYEPANKCLANADSAPFNTSGYTFHPGYKGPLRQRLPYDTDITNTHSSINELSERPLYTYRGPVHAGYTGPNVQAASLLTSRGHGVRHQPLKDRKTKRVRFGIPISTTRKFSESSPLRQVRATSVPVPPLSILKVRATSVPRPNDEDQGARRQSSYTRTADHGALRQSTPASNGLSKKRPPVPSAQLQSASPRKRRRRTFSTVEPSSLVISVDSPTTSSTLASSPAPRPRGRPGPSAIANKDKAAANTLSVSESTRDKTVPVGKCDTQPVHSSRHANAYLPGAGGAEAPRPWTPPIRRRYSSMPSCYDIPFSVNSILAPLARRATCKGRRPVVHDITSSGYAASQWATLGLTGVASTMTEAYKDKRVKLVTAFPSPRQRLETLRMFSTHLTCPWAMLVTRQFALGAMRSAPKLQCIHLMRAVQPIIRDSVKGRSIPELTLLVSGLLLDRAELQTSDGAYYTSPDGSFTITRTRIIDMADDLYSRARRRKGPPAPTTRAASVTTPQKAAPVAAKPTITPQPTSSFDPHSIISALDPTDTTSEKSYRQSITTMFATAGPAVRASPRFVPLLISAAQKCLSNPYSSVRAAAVRALLDVYAADRARLEFVIHLTMQFLATTGADEAKLRRRCKGVVAHLLLKEPARAKLALTTQGHLVLAAIPQAHETVTRIIKGWIAHARQPSAGFVDPDTWRDLLISLRRDNEASQQSDPTGPNYEMWEDDSIMTEAAQTFHDREAARGQSFIFYNCNGFRKRWENGELHELMRAQNPDGIFLTETKTDPRHLPDATDVKATLYALGYRYCYWTWCSTSRGHGYSGCALFSKVRPVDVRFGIGESSSVSSAEGRVITARFPTFSLIGTYSPCSAPGVQPTLRRVEHDKLLTTHLQEELKSQGVLLGGDLNVAPTTADAAVGELDEDTHGSCKPHERATFQKWISKLGMVDAYRIHKPHATPEDFTWHRSLHHYRQGMGLRVDHCLGSSTMFNQPCGKQLTMDVDGSEPYVAQIMGCHKVKRKFGSDHFPLHVMVRVRAPQPRTIDSASIPAASATQTHTTADHQHSCKDMCTCARDYGAATAAVFDTARDVMIKSRPPVYNDECRCPEDLSAWTLNSTDREQEQPRPAAAPSNGNHACAATICEDKAQTMATKPVAAAASDIPSQEELKSFLQQGALMNTMPEAKLPCGPRRIEGTILQDTGARANLMTQAFATRCSATQIPISMRHAPTFILANGKHTKPIGLAKIAVYVTPSHPLNIIAWVMNDGPADVIVGSESLRQYKCILNYETLQARYVINNDQVYVPFRSSSVHMHEAAVALFATEDILLPPKHHGIVPVNASLRSQVQQLTWGEIRNTGKENLFISAKMTSKLIRHQTWIQMSNLTDAPLLIRRGKHVANFHRQDRDYYREVHCDLDEMYTASTAAAAATTPEARPAAYSSFAHLNAINLGRGNSVLTAKELTRLKALIVKYHYLWDTHTTKQPAAHGVECTISLTGTPTMRARHRNVAPNARQKIAEIVKEKKDKGIIQESCSPYSSTVLLVPKPGGGVRFCVDFRELNKIIKRDAYPLPRVEDTLSSLHGKAYFSSIDIVTAFWQVPLAKESRELTAFATPDGLYEYLRMPMGLATASGVFSKFIDEVFRGLKWHCVLTYIDDCLIATDTFDKHMAALEEVFQRLDLHGLTLGAKKCSFCVNEVRFLGHLITPDGIQPDPDKTMAIAAMELPNDKKGLRSVLGLFGYYRKFCKDYSTVAAPLNSFLRNDKPLPRNPDGSVAWTEAETRSFNTLKRMLTTKPMLAHPQWTEGFVVDTDACGHGLGAVLSQKIDGVDQVIAYASRSLTDAEKGYKIWELETLAVVWATELFGWYLWSTPVMVRTDSNAVKWVLERATKGRLLRWALALQEIDYTIEHRPGQKNGNADGLSRCPLRSNCPYGEKRIEQIYGIAPPIHASAALPTFSSAAASAYFGDADHAAWNQSELLKLQHSDAICSPIMARIRDGTATKDDERFLLSDEGILKIRTHGPDDSICIVVPESLRAFILRRHHGLPISGHCGVKKVLAKLRARFWWRHLARDVKRWISACLVCRRRKTPRPRNAGTPAISCRSRHPGHTVAIDLVGPAEDTLNGNKYILTMMDLFTRWVVAVPIPSKDAHVIAHAIHSHWFCKYGFPERIFSDQGTEFVNKGLQSLCRRWSIRPINTTGWQPQANPIERVHRWLNSGMTSLHRRFGNEWDYYVDAVVFAFNTSAHESTGFSPYTLMHGRQPRLPEDALYGIEQRDFKDETGLKIYCSQWLTTAYRMAIEKQTRVAEYNRTCREARSRDVSFKRDDYVLYWQPGQKATTIDAGREATPTTNTGPYQSTPKKWTNRWTGPHRIIRKTSDNHYVFEHYRTAVEVKSHVNRLCIFRPWSETILSTSAEDDEPPRWKVGGKVAVGDLIAFPLLDDDNNAVPFGIAELTGFSRDGKSFTIRWFSNSTDNVRGTFKPGWLTRAKTMYYADKRRHRSDKPYEGSDTNTTVSHASVILHGFKLTSGHRLPTAVLRKISASGWVNWQYRE